VAMVDGMGIRQDFICKVVVSGISLVLNYVLSKWVVFRKVS
jgi:putative flippase GtrA